MNVTRDASGEPGKKPPDELGRSGGPALAKGELLATVFVTGAAVILIEILGTRVIGPVFGVSLFVWSALLAVTLGSLAAGYYAGGVLVDRTPTAKLLGLIVVAAGLLLGCVPLLSHPLLAVAETMGPRGGSLFAAAVLFTPSLVALGAVGPVAVRLGTANLRATGHSVGSVYAVSTTGSLIGTLCTGFLLIPAFDTNEILFASAIVLVAMGSASLAVHWRKSALVAVAAPILATMSVERAPLPHGFRVLDRSQSLYGLVEVIDDDDRQVRFLRADHSVLGAQFFRDHSSGFAFIHLLEAVRFVRPGASKMLQIGLGTGALPSVLRSRGITADVVEIDPAVVRFAREYFGFAPNGDIFEEDARTFLARTTNRYELIVHDTFTAGTTPEHLLSLEVLQRIHALLRPGGVLALNFVGAHDGPMAEASWTVMRTLRSVFPRVRAFADEPPTERPREAGNLLFFASDGDLAFTIPDDAHFENDVCERVLRSFQDWEVFATVPRGGIITDAHNALSRLQLPIAEDHFAAMNTLIPPEVWLH
jgi:spermidine synthase